MSIIFERFSDLPDFIDIRQDQYREAMLAIRTLESLNSDDPSEMLNSIQNLHLDSLSNNYANKCTDLSNNNSTLRRSMNRANFSRFKQIIGDDYV